MKELTISIEDGVVRYLNSEGSEGLTDLQEFESVEVTRASHVEPVNPVLRQAFYMLRHAFGEKGWMAEFTRHWPCMWRVNLTPIGKGILPGRWKDRQGAIDCEIRYLNKHFI